MSLHRRPEGPRPNLVYLDDHRAPDVDDMVERVEKEARRQDEAEHELDAPLPYEPELHAARDLPGMTDGERRRQPGKDAGEENQEPDDWGSS